MKYATVVVSVLILIAVLLPGSKIPDVGPGGFDKVVHFGMFVVWTIALRYDLDRRKPFPYGMALMLGVGFSALTEVIQILTEDRTFDVYDMMANLLGVLTGLAVSGPVVRWLQRK